MQLRITNRTTAIILTAVREKNRRWCFSGTKEIVLSEWAIDIEVSWEYGHLGGRLPDYKIPRNCTIAPGHILKPILGSSKLQVISVKRLTT